MPQPVVTTIPFIPALKALKDGAFWEVQVTVVPLMNDALAAPSGLFVLDS